MCDPILVIPLKMQPFYSQSSRKITTPFSGTSPLAYYQELPPPPVSLPPKQENIVEMDIGLSC